MKRIPLILCSLLATATASKAELYFIEFFDTGVTPYWSKPFTTTTSDSKRTFLGRFGAETVSFEMGGLPAHTSVTVQYELMIIQTWDGNGDEDLGPDRVRVEVENGPLLMDATFFNSMMVNKNWIQSFPDNYGEGEHPGRTGAIHNETMPFFWFNRPVNSIYRMTHTFGHSGSTLKIDFSGINLQGVSDESWGIDGFFLWIDGTGPFITLNPQSDYAPAGGELFFEVHTAGNPAPTYQWLKDGEPIPGANARTLTVSDATLEDSGSYTIEVTNPERTISSGAAEGVVFADAPEKLWNYELPKNVGTPGVDADGNVYIGSVDRKIYAFDSEGNLKWERQTQGTVSAAPIFDSDGHIIMGSRNGTVFSFNPDGTTNWMAQGVSTDGSPAMGLNGDILFPSRNEVLTSLSPDGMTNWQFSSSAAFEGSVAIDADGRIYATNEDGFLYCLSPEGVEQWNFQWSGYAIGSSPTIAPDGSILYGSTDGYLYAVNPAGNIEYGIPTQNVIDGSAIFGPDGSLYFGAGNGFVYGYDASGFRKWSKYFYVPVSSTPVVTADNTLIVGPVNKRIYGLNADTGAVKWAHDVGFELSGSSPVLDQNGKLYVGAGSRVHVFQTATRPADSSWPQFRRTPKNTANVAAPMGLPPTLELQAAPAGDQVTLQITGESHQTYRIDVSGDAVSWTPLQDLMSETPQMETTAPAGEGVELYRAVVR